MPKITLPIFSLAILLCSCGIGAPTDPQPSTGASPAPAAAPEDAHAVTVDWKEVSRIVGGTGELKNSVYHITVPRSDLMVNVEGMPVPTEAGLASVFHLWICPCGKTVMFGEFCLADYESNDVIDALRAGGVRVTAVSNMLIGEHPRLVGVRFYAEGEPLVMAKTLKAALDCTGDARTAKQPLP